MSKTTISASATGLPGKEELKTPNSPCRVAQLKHEAALVIDAHSRCDKQVAESGGEKSVLLEKQMRVLNEKLKGIEDAASIFPATSAIGALFQISLINSLVDLIDSFVPENSKHAGTSDDAQKAIVRMCYSIRDFLVSATDVNPEDGCGDYYMSDRYNPHRLIAAAINQEALPDD
jgi:hypothetical protein